MSKLILALFTYALLAQVGLVHARLTVLTIAGGPDGCSPRKIAKIKAAAAEAGQMAGAAVKALAQRDITQSPAFLDFLGAGNNPATISAGKFQSVQAAVGGKISEIASVSAAGTNDVTFICPPDDVELAAAKTGKGENPAAAQSTNKCNGFFFALASNNPSIIKVCPSFFDPRNVALPTGGTKAIKPNTLNEALALYRNGDKIGNCPAMTLLHEFQHSIPVVRDIVRDLESNVDPISGPPPPPPPGTKAPKLRNPAYSVAQCKGLSPINKIQNAQNFAWFAFDIMADATRAKPCGAPAGNGSGSGSGSGKGKGKQRARAVESGADLEASESASRPGANPPSGARLAKAVADATRKRSPAPADPAQPKAPAKAPAKSTATATTKAPTKASATSSAKAPSKTSASEAPACKDLKRGVIQQISVVGAFE